MWFQSMQYMFILQNLELLKMIDYVLKMVCIFSNQRPTFGFLSEANKSD